MAQEHRRRHKAHLDQHIKDANGEYHYVGDWYKLQGGGKALMPFLIWSVVSAAFLIAAGCLPFPGMLNTWYVIIPYLGTVSVFFALFWQGRKLAFSGGRVKTFAWENVKDNIFPITRALAVFNVLTGVLGGVYLLISKTAFSGVCLWFFLLLLLAAISAWIAGNAFKKQVWEIET